MAKQRHLSVTWFHLRLPEAQRQEKRWKRLEGLTVLGCPRKLVNG